MPSISIRVDAETKAQSEAVFAALGLSTSTAVCLFMRQVAIQGRIPFSLTTSRETAPHPQQSPAVETTGVNHVIIPEIPAKAPKPPKQDPVDRQLADIGKLIKLLEETPLEYS